MGIKTKTTLAISFVGVVAMTVAAFGQTGEPTPSREGTKGTQERRAAQQQRRAQAQEQRRDNCGRPNAPRARARRLVHSETKVQLREGYAVVTVDQGTVTAVDESSKKITIKRVDGETVTATAVDETKICRNGEPARFGTIRVGDHARLVQVRSERFTGLRAIFARTPQAESDAAPARPSSFDPLDEFVTDLAA